MLPTKAKDPVQSAGFQPMHSQAAVEKLGTKRARDLANSHKGLCLNCEKVEQCSYPSTISETWFCEEYSYASAERAPRFQMPKREKSEEEHEDTHLGLCVNCAHRETCQFPKPIGGVWFCGEYE